jgi:hypothetical protein
MPAHLKPEGMRQRRNKASTRTELDIVEDGSANTPKLPRCPNEGNWHTQAREWWGLVWTSPMAREFLQGDWPALVRLVVLVDLFWKNPGDLKIAGEIRLMEREFGLTPLSRRRLEWSVVQAEDSKDKHEQRRVARARVVDVDPRNVLVD